MGIFRPTSRLCNSCSCQLLNFFSKESNFTSNLIRNRSKSWVGDDFRRRFQPRARSITTSKALQASVEDVEVLTSNATKTPAQTEAIVRQARQMFGETLPEEFLSPEEYKVYERLYGSPSAVTLPEDVPLLQGFEEEDAEITETPRNVLMRENPEGNLEEILYEESDDVEEEGLAESRISEATDDVEAMDDSADIARHEIRDEFQARVTLLRDMAATKAAESRVAADLTDGKEGKTNDEDGADRMAAREEQDLDNEEDFEEDSNYERSDSARTHPLTEDGRFSTSPATVYLPKHSVVGPITALLADASNKHLTEVALKTFGGPGLPQSTATITRPNLRQQPIPLEAKQLNMGEMEGNVFLAAIMPGAYATIMSTLVEIRKRLGTEWLRSLLLKPGGPRILDAGAGGAGILAWREVLSAEWQSMHSGEVPHGKPVPYGKSTVVTGSTVLRHRASQLLDNTTFIPRLPDYDSSRDHPSLESKNPQPRKQYDIILAPHTLWTLKEDYMRKNQIQNFWSLLDPKGGVLVLIEKGIPRGFELIAGARDTLLKYQVASPGAEEVQFTIEDASQNRFGPKEKGMIIAPCTNHGKCPMYITAGQTKGRKDFCHFSQRFVRPPFLQRITGAREHNHEDIRFSYVAFQRGVDQRQRNSFSQGEPAALAAFEGYEEDHEGPTQQSVPKVNMLSLPRAILPPIKRRGHVTLDLCTPGGKIERWTVPKSFSKQAYRDARKSKWGDLWALGAKTRVARNIRVGLKTSKSETKKIDPGEVDDVDDGRRRSRRENQFGSRVNPRKTVKHKKRSIVHDE